MLEAEAGGLLRADGGIAIVRRMARFARFGKGGVCFCGDGRRVCDWGCVAMERPPGRDWRPEDDRAAFDFCACRDRRGAAGSAQRRFCGLVKRTAATSQR
jgi:hypothetical protein